MVRGNSFDCRRQDCPKKCSRIAECPHCGMPAMRTDVGCILDLYSRCRANNVLPYAGGLLDQPAWLMDLFSVIDDIKAAYKKSEVETEEAKAKINGRPES